MNKENHVIVDVTTETLYAFDNLRADLSKELNDLRNQFKALSEDGWKIKEVTKFLILSVSPMYEMLRAKEMTEEYKGYFILETLEDLYYEYNPEWSHVPDFIERMIEDFMFDHILPNVVEAVRKQSNIERIICE